MTWIAGASSFFVDPRRELGPEGGGDLTRGEIGHCGVVSPEAVALFTGLANLDTASVTDVPRVWVCVCCGCSCGTLEADSARCMAAAEGVVDNPVGIVVGLSFRVGDALREVCGLCPVAGDGTFAASAVDDDFLSVGVFPPAGGVLFVPFLTAFAFAALAVGSAVSTCPLSERNSTEVSLLLLFAMTSSFIVVIVLL